GTRNEEQRRGGVARARARDHLDAQHVEELRGLQAQLELHRRDHQVGLERLRDDDLGALQRLAPDLGVLDDELLHVLELAGHHDVGVDQRPAPDAHVRAHLAHESVLGDH
ncbi:MAG: hypothetical protein ACK559_13330, partial [bacterium]